MKELPLLPYAGTSGWAGSEASRDRAVAADKNGSTRARQKATLDFLARAGSTGATWQELSDASGWHHGVASSVLSVLHKEGLVTRLRERRARCSVYVMPDFVNGRPTEGRRRNLNGRAIHSALDGIEAAVLRGDSVEALRLVRELRKAGSEA